MNRGAFVAIININEVLLVRSLTNMQFVDLWSLPGGVVNDAETLQAAAKREAIEETGIVCQVGRLISEVDNVESNIRVSIFRADYKSGEIKEDKVEIAEAKWFKLSDAVNLPLAYNTEAVIKAL